MRIEIVSPYSSSAKILAVESGDLAGSLAKRVLGREDDGTDVSLMRRSDGLLLHHDEEIGSDPDPEGYEIALSGGGV